MTVYIDDYRGRCGRMIMCHMVSDSLEELHAFAARLGMQREWFQQKSIPHYDVSLSRRKVAVELGAVEVPIKLPDGKCNPRWREVFGQQGVARQAALGGEVT